MSPVDHSLYQNEIVRASHHAGLSILEMMEKELLDATLLGKSPAYLEGVATAITIVRSPLSWQNGDERVKQAVLNLVREARARGDLL